MSSRRSLRDGIYNPGPQSGAPAVQAVASHAAIESSMAPALLVTPAGANVVRRSGSAVRQALPGWVAPVVGALVCTLALGAFRWYEAATENSGTRTALVQLVQSNRDRAHQAFAEGAFRDAVAFLDPLALKQSDDRDLELLYAQSLECLCKFKEAAKAYNDVMALPYPPVFGRRALKFCTRMAADHRTGDLAKRELNYRLHEELMRRGQADAARYVARRLLPDEEPLRKSVTILLQKADPKATLTLAPGKNNLVEVSVTKVTPFIVGLLHDLHIGTLSVVDGGLSDTRLLAGLDVRALDLSVNRLSDLSALSGLHIQRLSLSDTDVADVRALANLPLRELDLSHTHVNSLYPLALCPLEKLNLAGLPVQDLSPLRGLALHKLDLSHTRVRDLSMLASLPIEELQLDGTMIYDLQPLAGMKLKKLSLAGTAVKDLSPLAGMPLAELDLRGCALVNDLAPIANCVSLEKVCLPGHLKAPVAFRDLPRLKFIEYERARNQAQPPLPNQPELLPQTLASAVR